MKQWNFLAYFLMITTPLANYLTAVALVGSQDASKSNDKFFSHRWFFSALAATWAVSAINTWYLLGVRPCFLIAMIPIAVAGALFDKRWIRCIILGLMVVTFFLTAAVEFTL